MDPWGAVVSHLLQVLETKRGSSAELRLEPIGSKLQADMVTVPALGRERQEDQEVQVSTQLSTVKLCL